MPAGDKDRLAMQSRCVDIYRTDALNRRDVSDEMPVDVLSHVEERDDLDPSCRRGHSYVIGHTCSEPMQWLRGRSRVRHDRAHQDRSGWHLPSHRTVGGLRHDRGPTNASQRGQDGRICERKRARARCHMHRILRCFRSLEWVEASSPLFACNRCVYTSIPALIGKDVAL